jgi:hypothetical protein
VEEDVLGWIADPPPLPSNIQTLVKNIFSSFYLESKKVCCEFKYKKVKSENARINAIERFKVRASDIKSL